MKKLLIISKIMLFFVFTSSSQDFCVSKLNMERVLNIQNSLSKTSRNYNGQRPMIRLALHRVTKTDGSGGISWVDIRNWVQTLPTAYNQFDICFTVTNEDEINDSEFNSLKTIYSMGNYTQEYLSLIQLNVISNAINIYFVDQSFGGIASGFLFNDNVSYPTVVISRRAKYSRNIVNSLVLAHEIGHCLGLLHTHDNELGIENVERSGANSNCNTTGDLLCDTEADPNLEQEVSNVSDVNCAYVGNASRNGVPYTPNTRNVMSYTLPSCMLSFTAGQGNRMRNFILNSNNFDSYFIANQRTVAGNFSGDSYWGVENQLQSPSTTTLFKYSNVSSGKTIFEAGQSILLNPGFNTSFSNSGTFEARINSYSCLTPLVKNSAKTDETSENDNSQIFIEDNFDDISLFPNPVIDKVFIEINATKMTLCDMDIFDVSGRQVYSEKYNLKKGKNAYQFDLKSLSSGFYFAKFNIGGLISMKKFQVESRQ